MRRTWIAIAAAALLSAATLSPLGAQPMPEPETQNGITFISGGVGDDSQQAMLAVKQAYNLRMLFAREKTGEYFAMLPVRISDVAGNPVLSATSAGPFFYARMKPGRYKVEVIHQGQWLSKIADVPAVGAAELFFYWP